MLQFVIQKLNASAFLLYEAEIQYEAQNQKRLKLAYTVEACDTLYSGNYVQFPKLSTIKFPCL